MDWGIITQHIDVDIGCDNVVFMTEPQTASLVWLVACGGGGGGVVAYKLPSKLRSRSH